MDSIGAALVRSGLQRPMVYRLISKTGARPIVEVTANSRLDDPESDGLMVYVRPWGERWWLDQVLEAIAGSAPLKSTLRLLVEVMRAETLAGDGVLLHEPSGSGAGRAGSWRPGWGRPRPVRRSWPEPVDRGRDDRPAGAPARPPTCPPSWRPRRPSAATTGAGRGRCPAPRGRTPQACLVLWREADEDADHTCRVSMDRLVRLTELVHGR